MDEIKKKIEMDEIKKKKGFYICEPGSPKL